MIATMHKIVLLGLLGIFAQSAGAVGFGAMKAESKIGEPFRAVVEVSSDVEEQCLELVTPDNAHRDETWISRTADFRLNKSATHDKKILVVTGRQAVTAPVVNVRLRHQCPNSGTLVRDYLIILDNKDNRLQ